MIILNMKNNTNYMICYEDITCTDKRAIFCQSYLQKQKTNLPHGVLWEISLLMAESRWIGRGHDWNLN